MVRRLTEWFANRTALADLTSVVEVSEIKQEMEYSWIPENLQPVIGEGSWVVVTKSTSQVLLDTSSSAEPPAAAKGGPGLNYETTNAMLCSHLSQQPLIFNHYGDHTFNTYTRSYSQALQTSLDYEWYAINVRVRGSLGFLRWFVWRLTYLATTCGDDGDGGGDRFQRPSTTLQWFLLAPPQPQWHFGLFRYCALS